MYYIYGISGPSLLIESTDSMILLLLEQPVATWSSCKETLSSKLQSIPAAKELSPPKLQSTPTTIVGERAQVAMDITESPLIQHPSPKVSTHVHGLGYSLIHPLCITAVMYKLLLLEQPVAAWSSCKGTFSSKTSNYPSCKGTLSSKTSIYTNYKC